jgi:hypothetical protein
MKKYIIFLACLTLGFVSSGQSKFTQATLKEMLKEYNRDSKAFFINRLSNDFRYSNQQGQFLYKRDVSKSDAGKVVTTLQAIEGMLENALRNDILEPIILQSCDLAIVSGRHKTALVGNNGNKMAGEVACTYAFQKRKGKWMFVASQQTSLAE